MINFAAPETLKNWFHRVSNCINMTLRCLEDVQDVHKFMDMKSNVASSLVAIIVLLFDVSQGIFYQFVNMMICQAVDDVFTNSFLGHQVFHAQRL